MVFHTGFPNQFQISCDLGPFAFGADATVAVFFCVFAVMDVTAPKQFVDFAVGYNHFAQRLGPKHGLTHHIVTLDTPAVIGKTADIGGHTLQIRQFFTLFAYGDGAVGVYMNAGAVFNEL